MKKIFLSFSILSAVIFSACNSKKEDTSREMVFLNDSLYRSSVNADTAALVQELPQEEEAPYVASRPATPKKMATQKSRTVRNNSQPVYEPVQSPPPAVKTPLPTPAPTGETTATGTGTETASGPGTTTGTGAETPAKKTGMSNGAKGAIIGGVGGAVAGAVISKKGKGAVLGGIIGAAGGYILGRKKDRAKDTVGNFQQPGMNR